MPAYTDAGDVFAMPCRTRLWGLQPEAWGIVLLEAQACGLPVVVGRSGGAPEALVDVEGGRVVGDDRGVVDALVALLSKRRARVASDAVVAWTWDHGAERLSELWVG
jgi:phosphatidylinositol alpha-1,6-mannosyltransferase